MINKLIYFRSLLVLRELEPRFIILPPPASPPGTHLARAVACNIALVIHCRLQIALAGVAGREAVVGRRADVARAPGYHVFSVAAAGEVMLY